MSSKFYMERMERLRIQIEQSELDDAEKDGYFDILDAARAACEGEPDIGKVLQALSVSMEFQVRMALRKAKECAECMAQMMVPTRPEYTGKLGFIIEIKWPLAVFGSVLAFSPHATEMLEAILKLAN
jgi:hypothetical protein